MRLIIISLIILYAWGVIISPDIPEELHEKAIDQLIPYIRDQNDLEGLQKKIDQTTHEVQYNSTSRFLFIGVVAILASIFSQGEGDFGCKACQAGVAGLARVSRWSFTKPMVLYGITKICERTGKSLAVCKGVSESTGSTLFRILSEMDLDNVYVRPTTCYAFGNVCSLPEFPEAKLDLPPKRSLNTTSKRSNRVKYILQLSDLHFDEEYLEGAESECSRPLCCQPDSNADADNPSLIRRPAGKWGEYRCDINRRLLDSLLRAAARLNKKYQYDMILFSGDIPAHDMWKETIARGEHTSISAFNMLHRHLNFGPPLYPVIGNHESVPINQFPLNGKLDSKDFYLYEFLAEQWKRWLPIKSLTELSQGGYYSVQHNPRLKVITLNNNLCYTYNFYLLLDAGNPDPNGILKWFINELQSAEDNDSRVIVLGHIPPGSLDCYRHWSDSYYKIIQRYHHIISGQYYGHEHSDEFELFYSNPARKIKKNAIGHAFLAPSMTTFDYHNPGFRVYKVDARTYQVIDYMQYAVNLTESRYWHGDAPWKLLYSARSTYGRNLLTDRTSLLDPPFWHKVSGRLLRQQDLFQAFYNLRNLGAGHQPECRNVTCRAQHVCTLRAGKSRENCNTPVPFT